MAVRPLHDNLLVMPLEEEHITAAGIVLPDTAKEKPEKGEVVAIGPGKRLENGQRSTLQVKVGDKVIFKKYAPDEIKVEGKEYFIIAESDVLAVIE